jgi:hypothetical protein
VGGNTSTILVPNGTTIKGGGNEKVKIVLFWKRLIYSLMRHEGLGRSIFGSMPTFLPPNKRMYMCTKSMLNFCKYHADSIVLTNAFDIRWQSSYNGSIVQVQQVLQVPLPPEELQAQVEEFIHWHELYTFGILRSVKWALPKREIKKVDWTASKILRRFHFQFEVRQAYGTNIRDFIGGSSRDNNRPPREYLEQAEVPDDDLRELLNQIYAM